MNKIIIIVAGLALIVAGVLGCQNAVAPNQDADDPYLEYSQLEQTQLSAAIEALSSPLVTVNVGSDALEFWPYTGTDFSGKPQDPINLIFYGKADPRDIRAALMALDGNRDIPGLPDVPPFNSRWTDAIGDVQTGYALPNQWTGSVIQLACGSYEPMRFHIRLFQAGKWTVANAHFEVLIPGTTDHQVLSWELAEQFVIADLMRTGLLDAQTPLIPTSAINASPFRTIAPPIYNGLPVELRALIGGPLGDVTDDVPINTDGHAVIVNLAKRRPWLPGFTSQDFEINFGQVIPKPFCASGPYDYLWVEGPVRLTQRVHLSRSGVYQMHFWARGELTVTPVNPLTGEPIGESLPAYVIQCHTSEMNGHRFSASGVIFQKLGCGHEEGGGRLFTRLQVTSNGHNGFDADIRCNDDNSGSQIAGQVRPTGLLDAKTEKARAF